MSLAPVVGRIVGENTDYVRALHDSERRTKSMTDSSEGHFNRLGSGIKTFAKVAAVGLLAGAVAVGAFLKSSAQAAEESRKVTAQTNAVIASTGGVANVSAAGVGKLADQLAALTGIDDEVIAGGQNILLTFTKVRNEVGKGNDIFNQGTKAALNMSVALKQDLQSSSMLVGKALNDPIKGMAALTRSGIQFTDQQKAQVKALVESGNVLGAQKIILKELETQFGGSAAAAASPMERLKVVVGNLQEALGARLLPVIATVATFLATRLPGALDAVGRVVGPLVATIRMGVGGLRDAFSGQGVTSDGFVGVMERIGVAARAVVDWVRAHWPDIQNVISGVMATVQASVSGALNVIVPLIERIGPIAKDAFGTVADTVGRVGQVLSDNQGTIETVATIIATLLIPHLVLLGIEAMVSAGKQAAAWAITHTKAIVASAVHTAQVVIMVAKWILLGSVAMVQAAIIAAAWLISLGPIALVVLAVIGLAVVFVRNWDTIRSAVLTGVQFVVDKILGMAEWVTRAGAAAFGWVPGVGDKLRDAARALERFRDDAIAYLASIRDKTIRVNFVVTEQIQASAVPKRYQANYKKYHSGGILAGPRGAEVPFVGQAGEGIFTRGQMAALGAAAMGTAGAGRGGGGGTVTNHYHLDVYTATGDIPDSTLRKLRRQLFEMGNDVPPGSIVPAA